MSAVDEIQQAIDTLTRLKAESTPGYWVRQPWVSRGEGVSASVFTRSTESPEIPRTVTGDTTHPANAELIVTLHRTIDAQLAILRHAIAKPHNHLGEWRLIDNDAAVLAEAINGATS